MHILTTGGMEDFSKYLGVNWTFSLICFVFWIFSPAEGHKTISSVGSKAVLPCNVSLSKLQQLTWKMNGVTLYSLKEPHKPHTSGDAVRLNIKMSESESEQYALVMKQVQTSHGGNYTCEVATDNGTQEFMWELIVTGKAGTFPAEMSRNNLVIIVAAIVGGVCCLVFIFSWTCLRRACKCRANHQFPTTIRQAKTEDIYENCLQNRRDQPSSYNPTHVYEV